MGKIFTGITRGFNTVTTNEDEIPLIIYLNKTDQLKDRYSQ